MLRIVITGAALALALPAFAQGAQTADPSAQVPGQSGGTAAAQGAGSSPGGASQVSAIVESEFPVYDADKSGELDKSEFSKWVIALKQQEAESSGRTMAQGELTSWASSAFKTADADRSTTVSKTEFTRYLGG